MAGGPSRRRATERRELRPGGPFVARAVLCERYEEVGSGLTLHNIFDALAQRTPTFEAMKAYAFAVIRVHAGGLRGKHRLTFGSAER